MISLLDTNVLSQSAKIIPEQRVKAWSDTINEADTCISVISLAELTSGIQLMPAGRKRDSLSRWLDVVVTTFRKRTLPVTSDIAITAGQINGSARTSGHNAELGDLLLAATARVHGLQLVTLNTKHFTPLSVELTSL